MKLLRFLPLGLLALRCCDYAPAATVTGLLGRITLAWSTNTTVSFSNRNTPLMWGPVLVHEGNAVSVVRSNGWFSNYLAYGTTDVRVAINAQAQPRIVATVVIPTNDAGVYDVWELRTNVLLTVGNAPGIVRGVAQGTNIITVTNASGVVTVHGTGGAGEVTTAQLNTVSNKLFALKLGKTNDTIYGASIIGELTWGDFSLSTDGSVLVLRDTAQDGILRIGSNRIEAAEGAFYGDGAGLTNIPSLGAHIVGNSNAISSIQTVNTAQGTHIVGNSNAISGLQSQISDVVGDVATKIDTNAGIAFNLTFPDPAKPLLFGAGSGTYITFSNGFFSIYASNVLRQRINATNGETEFFGNGTEANKLTLRGTNGTGAISFTLPGDWGDSNTFVFQVTNWQSGDVLSGTKSGNTVTLVNVPHGPQIAALSNSWVNVKAYGATGDGSTDDWASISNAINAAAVYGTVFFPTGTYRVTAPINQQNKFVHFIGAGRGGNSSGGTRLIGSLSNAPILQVISPGSDNGIVVDGFNISNTHTNGMGVKTVGYASGSLRNLQIDAWRGIDVQTNSFTTTIEKCRISWSGTPRTNSIGIIAGGHTTVKECDVVGFNHGVRIFGLSSIMGCRLEVNNVGIMSGMDGAGVSYSHNGAIIGNSMEANDIGIFEYATTSAIIAGNAAQGSGSAPAGASIYGLYIQLEYAVQKSANLFGGTFTGSAVGYVPGYFQERAVVAGHVDQPFAVIVTNGTASLVVSTNKNVGVGTNNPSFPLDVHGQANIRSDSGLRLIDNSGTIVGQIVPDAGSGGVSIRLNSINAFNFNINGSGVGNMTLGANVGIVGGTNSNWRGTLTATNGFILPTNAPAILASITNGLSMTWNSNGAVYRRTSRRGSTTVVLDTLVGAEP